MNFRSPGVLQGNQSVVMKHLSRVRVLAVLRPYFGAMLTYLGIIAMPTGVRATVDDSYVSRSGLTLWLRADTLTQADGSSVSSWGDQSGNGNSAGQAVSAQQPAFIASALNGLPVVHFTATSKDYMSVANAGSLNPSQISIISVIKRASGTGVAVIAEKYIAGTGPGYSLRMQSATTARSIINSSNATGAIASGTFQLLAGIYDQVNSKVFVNGVATGTTAYASATTATSNPLYIGGQPTQNNFDGDVAEMMVYDHALSDDDRKNIEAYVYTKYAVGSSPLASAPVFSVSGGTYANTQIETLNCSAGGTIYYTLDGTPPTTSSLIYTDALVVNSTTTIKAITVKPGFQNSQAWQAVITIDPSTFYVSRTGLAVWLKADSLALASGSKVALWTDQSGIGNDALQGTAANQPTLITAVLNGWSVVRFTAAANNYLSVADNASLTASQVSVFAVVKRATGTGVAIIAEKYIAGTGPGYSFRMQTGTSVRSIVNSNNATASMSSGSFYVLDHIYDQVNNSIYVNGVLAGATAYTAAINANSNPVYVGGQPAQNSFDGDIAEMMIYNRALSDADRRGIEAYFNSKYLIGTAVATSPVFGVKTGTYAGAQIESITAPSGATIYYTLDGSMPTTSSTPYSAPFTVSSNCSINAIAVMAGFQNSLVSLAQITIDPSSSYLSRSGLKLWLKADSLTSSNGASVSQWSDQSGSSNDALQATVTNRPSFVTGVINGKPCIRFTAAAKNYMSVSNVASLNPSQLSVFGVIRRSFGSGVAVVLEKYIAGTGPGYSLRMQSATTARAIINSSSATGAIASGAFQLLGSVYDQSNNSVYVNGTLTGSAAYSATLSVTSNPLYIGGQPTQNNFDGDVAEMMVYDHALNGTDRRALEAYVYLKYGVGAPPVLDAPVFSISSGNYSTAQSVAMSSQIGAVIYFTRNGNIPNTGSESYIQPLSISSPETIEAIATALGYQTSAVATLRVGIVTDVNDTQDGLLGSYSIDSDHDGVPDAVETLVGTDSNNPNDGNAAASVSFNYDSVHQLINGPGRSYQLDNEGNIKSQ